MLPTYPAFVKFHQSLDFCNAIINDVLMGSALHLNHPESYSLYCFWYFNLKLSSVKMCCLFLFCPSCKIYSVLLPSVFPLSVFFFVNNYTFFIKRYRYFFLSHGFLWFLFQWYLYILDFISSCYPHPSVCCCSHVACHTSTLVFVAS